MHNINISEQLKLLSKAITAAALFTVVSAHAAPVLEGKTLSGAQSTTCTVSGATKCAMFYDSALDVTILNERIWGAWSSTSAAGSAQEHAESLGFTATGLTGWTLPTLQQYHSLWNKLGNSIWQDYFGSLIPYWSNEASSQLGYAWSFDVTQASPTYIARYSVLGLGAFAVRPGDVFAVPEPSSLALLTLGVVTLVWSMRRRRPN